LYELRIHCGPNYPNEPPKVRFCTKINLTCVDQRTGEVTAELGPIAGWNRDMGIETVLIAIKNAMSLPQNRRAAQHPEGSRF
jgi:ubiquitin-conjugating enzyme E2 variant